MADCAKAPEARQAGHRQPFASRLAEALVLPAWHRGAHRSPARLSFLPAPPAPAIQPRLGRAVPAELPLSPCLVALGEWRMTRS